MPPTYLTRTIVAAIGMTVVLAACGTTSSVRSTAHPTRSSADATSGSAPEQRPQSLLPEPSGRFAVGVRTVAGVVPAATTRVWYPARRNTGTGTPIYLEGAAAAALGVTAEQLHDVGPRAAVDAEPLRARQARPVVVLMPGWGSVMALSTGLAQDLASDGYVVVAADPEPGSEDGSTMPADPAKPGRRLEQISAALDFVTGPAIAALVGPVDVHRIAVGGHSIAGAIAFQVGLTDRRVHAVFDLDGWLHGSALAAPIAVPALMIDASGLEPTTRAVVARSASAVTVELAGATHYDVTDLPCLVSALGPAARVLQLGTIGCAGATTTITIVHRFLDTVLRDGGPSPTVARLTRGLAAVR